MNEIICSEIIDINSSGFILKHKKTSVFISFDECSRNYANEKSVEMSKCVATRDITKLTFTFYTNPKTEIVFKKNFLKDLFSGKSAVGKFLDLEKIINKYGYTSYDLS